MDETYYIPGTDLLIDGKDKEDYMDERLSMGVLVFKRNGRYVGFILHWN